MHPADIQAAIKKAKLTQKAIAKEYGCAEFTVSRIINSGWGSEPLMRFIAKKIGKEPLVVFREYFLRPNKRIKKAA